MDGDGHPCFCSLELGDGGWGDREDGVYPLGAGSNESGFHRYHCVNFENDCAHSIFIELGKYSLPNF